MATRFERIHEELSKDLEEIKKDFDYENLSNAFEHFILKTLFGLTDAETSECNTDGHNDNGIDAVYFEDNRIAHFFQFKFPGTQKNISKGITEEEILKLCKGVEDFTGNTESFETVAWNDILKDKREEFQNANIYDLKLWFVRYTNQGVSESALGKLKSFKDKYNRETGNNLEYEFILASECSKLYEKNIKNIWPDFKMYYKRNLSSFSDGKVSISSAYVTLKSIFDTFEPISHSVFEGNVRYLNLNSKINDGIKESIIHNATNFHVLNNGITIVCNRCNDNTANSFLDVKCGSIINGTQTVGTIINTLSELSQEEFDKYEKSFVFVRIISFADDNELVNEMVYTLNTQNQMRSSYTIANDPIVKKVQNHINTKTNYFLEVKNNEYEYLKHTTAGFDKLAKNKIDIETFIQAYVTFYNIGDMAYLSKTNKAAIFSGENIQRVINELDSDKSVYSYEIYFELMEIIKEYRAYRKDHNKTEILNKLHISENEINDYRFLNTGNYLVLYALGLSYSKYDVDPRKNMVHIIKALKVLFKKSTNISNDTKLKETFDKVASLTDKFKNENGVITSPKKVDVSKL